MLDLNRVVPVFFKWPIFREDLKVTYLLGIGVDRD